ncbi:hypothetical protein E4U60_007540 [Claviceps pazoutovae]|uniref:Uncharacterized protein n=1 Tax=Claviceps pazoutovae TaxID=1649127 RepID=A0A9P7SCW2_9HYPO|nr:hypothetical protein E4U60_007540 [Claviceps pazoutovae]
MSGSIPAKAVRTASVEVSWACDGTLSQDMSSRHEGSLNLRRDIHCAMRGRGVV